METTDTLDGGNIRGCRERSGSSNGQEDIFAAQADSSWNLFIERVFKSFGGKRELFIDII